MNGREIECRTPQPRARPDGKRGEHAQRLPDRPCEGMPHENATILSTTIMTIHRSTDRRSRAGRLACVLALAALPSAAAAQSASGPPSGEAIYKTRCAACHDNADGRTPSKATLQAMTSSRILRTLDFGAMMNIAYALAATSARPLRASSASPARSRALGRRPTAPIAA